MQKKFKFTSCANSSGVFFRAAPTLPSSVPIAPKPPSSS